MSVQTQLAKKLLWQNPKNIMISLVLRKYYFTWSIPTRGREFKISPESYQQGLDHRECVGKVKQVGLAEGRWMIPGLYFLLTEVPS